MAPPSFVFKQLASVILSIVLLLGCFATTSTALSCAIPRKLAGRELVVGTGFGCRNAKDQAFGPGNNRGYAEGSRVGSKPPSPLGSRSKSYEVFAPPPESRI